MFSLFKKKPKRYKNINAEEFSALKDKKNHIILDVRSRRELAQGAIPHHTLIDFFSAGFRTQISKLDKSKVYLVYCRSGRRSGQACAMMADMGFSEIYNLKGGINAWNKMATVS